MAQASVGMILTRYLSSEGWVEECSHANPFDAYIDARRRCVLRGCPYLLVDAEATDAIRVSSNKLRACITRLGRAKRTPIVTENTGSTAPLR